MPAFVGIHAPVFATPKTRRGWSSTGSVFERVADASRQVRSNQVKPPNSPSDCFAHCWEPEVRLRLQTRKFGTDAPQFRCQMPIVNRR